MEETNQESNQEWEQRKIIEEYKRGGFSVEKIDPEHFLVFSQTIQIYYHWTDTATLPGWQIIKICTKSER